MAVDKGLRRVIAEQATIQAAIDQLEDDNTIQGSFGDVEIRRVELRTLNCQRGRVNARAQQRKASCWPRRPGRLGRALRWVRSLRITAGGR